MRISHLAGLVVCLSLTRVGRGGTGEQLLHIDFSQPSEAFTVSGGNTDQGPEGLTLQPGAVLECKPFSKGLRRFAIECEFVSPDLRNATLRPLASNQECYCAFKVLLGDMVAELSDQWVRFFRRDPVTDRPDTVYGQDRQTMVPDGSTLFLRLVVENRHASLFVNDHLRLHCRLQGYDLRRLGLSTFGHTFTLRSLWVTTLRFDTLLVDRQDHYIEAAAHVFPSRFNHRGGLKNHHFIVWKGGRAAPHALIRTLAPDSAIHDALVSIGATPGNNLKLATWDKRKDPNAPEPDLRAKGSHLTITLRHAGIAYPVDSLLTDRHAKPFVFRFAGNRKFIPDWQSGCVTCLQSCPGGKIGNCTYTIRDLTADRVDYEVARPFPFEEGEQVRVRISLSSPPSREAQ